MPTSLDLSDISELRSLAGVVRTVNDAARDVADRWLVVGATARDLILHQAHGMPMGRATVDLDIGVAVLSWEAFGELQERLVEKGAQRASGIAHRLVLHGWQIDAVPFGGVERDGMIVWPPADNTAMSVLGFNEASRHAIEVVLPDGVTVAVASPPALLLLKLIAWEERHRRLPRHDAGDIRKLIDSYAAPWNEDRLYEDADDLLQRFGYDNALAAAALLGRDAREIAATATADRVNTILEREASGETLLLASDMNGRVQENLTLLDAVRVGFSDAAL